MASPPLAPESLAQVHADRFGIYFHIPFCRSKCPYCDFLSFPLDTLDAGKRKRLAAGLRKELALMTAHFPELQERRLDTVYFGGGTPSLLSDSEIRDILSDIFHFFVPRTCLPDVEITLECNPSLSETEAFFAFRKAGVNRISLGVQSFHADILSALGRGHSPEDAVKAIQSVQNVGFDSWGLDLIFGAPGSSPTQWKHDLETAIAQHPPHISVYGLTLHEGTPLFEACASGAFSLPDEETQRGMFLSARRFLTRAGWEHYEISNYARPGHRSRHNALYWILGEYLGIGLGASSYWGGRRRVNPDAPDAYLRSIESGVPPCVIEPLPPLRSLRAERIMLALRQCEGVEKKTLDELIGCDFQREYEQETRLLADQGLLKVAKGKIRLTEEGLLLSDTVFETFF